jgi:hypothetical protein
MNMAFLIDSTLHHNSPQLSKNNCGKAQINYSHYNNQTIQIKKSRSRTRPTKQAFVIHHSSLENLYLDPPRPLPNSTATTHTRNPCVWAYLIAGEAKI